ncbi:MAG: sel1 repeat family protein [Micavibrio sp.]|nr:MAG: sel1 repeat family protein [Micavibrio sp.]
MMKYIMQRKITFFPVIVAALLVLAVFFHAPPAVKADGGDSPQATEQDYSAYKRRAAAGDMEAQEILGDLYREGRGVEKNPVKAMEWYRGAAAQGSCYAYARMGMLYYHGEGVAQNQRRALRLFVKALGDHHSNNAERAMFIGYEGQRIPEDRQELISWCEPANSVSPFSNAQGCYGEFDMGMALIGLITLACIFRLMANFYQMLRRRQWMRWKNMLSNTAELIVLIAYVYAVSTAKSYFCPREAYALSHWVDNAGVIGFILYFLIMAFWWGRRSNRGKDMENDLPESLNVWLCVLAILLCMAWVFLLSLIS